MSKHLKEDFPYLNKVHVNDCFACQNISIDFDYNDQGFRHLILTGKNGSGKTTILDSLAMVVNLTYIKGESVEQRVNYLNRMISANPGYSLTHEWLDEIDRLQRVSVYPETSVNGRSPLDTRNIIFSFFKANRKTDLVMVETVTKEEEVVDKINKVESAEFARLFKQFLVNKKVYQAFAVLNGANNNSNEYSVFFENLEDNLRNILDDDGLKLEFVQEQFEFYVRLSDGRLVTFNNMSSGYSSYLNIVMDLIMRVDIIRSKVKDYTYNPCGIVVIDEPENHLHLELQYNILPTLVFLFPNIQFVVATHSPAVISSIKNTVIYDLSSKDKIGDEAVGSSYSELMVSHFGLDNEYSNIVDKIIADAEEIFKEEDGDVALFRMLKLIRENVDYISPVLRLDLESRLKAKLKHRN